eukprot:TRINITY_DN2370_c0_g1_i1.p1 TRINITY_DN2370_c0_g1~~TRINITY_DN2370_c0_g1_i1.p1  ORF type:complete len:336 (+),score=83.05 TRINITY_DN2370_c0_g1_i1:484-1491(+)
MKNNINTSSKIVKKKSGKKKEHDQINIQTLVDTTTTLLKPTVNINNSPKWSSTPRRKQQREETSNASPDGKREAPDPGSGTDEGIGPSAKQQKRTHSSITSSALRKGGKTSLRRSDPPSDQVSLSGEGGGGTSTKRKSSGHYEEVDMAMFSSEDDLVMTGNRVIAATTSFFSLTDTKQDLPLQQSQQLQQDKLSPSPLPSSTRRRSAPEPFSCGTSSPLDISKLFTPASSKRKSPSTSADKRKALTPDLSSDKKTLSSSGPKDYAYYDVVRKKEERANLPSHECDQCKQFYDAVGGNIDRKRMVDNCSRHKAMFNAPDTPTDYWELDFPDSPKKT